MPSSKSKPTRRRRSPDSSGQDRVLAPAAPELLRNDLSRWAGSRVAETGKRYALLGRVSSLRVTPDGREIHARVRGARPAPYEVVVRLTSSGSVESRCTCSQDAGGPCRHAVASLEALRFPLRSAKGGPPGRRHAGRRARGQGRVIQKAPIQPGFSIFGGDDRTLTKDERIDLAADAERQQRKARARRERGRVTLLPPDGLPPRFLVARRGGAPAHLVTLRGPKADRGACTCADFARSELGTCVHIERAKRWYLRKPKSIPKSVLSVWARPRPWVRDRAEPIREVRIDLGDGRVPERLREYFDQSGWLEPPAAPVDLASWFDGVLDAVRRFADEARMAFDLDPAVPGRVREAAAERKRIARLASVVPGAFDRVRDRLDMKLHRYQDEGVEFLARRGRAFLADDMGLGKTVQAIAAVLVLRYAVDARKCLVVCPASLKHQWEAEIAKACGEKATVVDGRRALRVEAYERWKRGFLVLNYELVLRDLDLLRVAGADVIVLDEAQRIKNWDTKTARAVKQLRSPYAFILTGTPLENRLAELHSLVEFLHSRALGPRWRLVPFHAVVDGDGKVVAYEDLAVIRRRLVPFFLRRERGTVLDQLPDKTENTFWTGMTQPQARAYRAFSSRVAKILSKGGALGPAEVRALLQALTSMRILCNSLAQHTWERFEDVVRDPSKAGPDAVRELHSPKLEEFVNVMEDLLEQSAERVVVFSQWERTLVLARFAIADLLRRRGESAGIYHGGLNGKSRVRLLDRFRKDPRFRVLFSTDAGGLGLNLQHAASIVVNLEVPWNPAVLEQRVARVHRLGQNRSVQVLHFVTRGGIEERVRQVVEDKRALFDGLLVDNAESVSFDKAGQGDFVEQVRSLLEDGDRPIL